MIKSDFSEVKKMLKRKNGNLQTIWATYVNSEKTVLFSSILSLSQWIMMKRKKTYLKQ